jgi:hypothetical protein
MSSGEREWGWVNLEFWYGTVFSWPSPATASSPPWFWLWIRTNQTGLARTQVVWFPSDNSTIVSEGWSTSKHFNASTRLTTTSLSKVKHRIWEFSVQLFPYIVHQPLTQNATNVGFNVEVWDSGGNLMELVGVSQPGRLIFVETAPVPELSSTTVIMAFAILVPLFLLRKKKKSGSNS